MLIRASQRDIKPQITGILWIVDEEFKKMGCETTVWTSGWREHGEGSLHPYGYAADFDSPQMPEDLNDSKWTQLRVRLMERLGKEYDVLSHGPRAHVHIEYDPRKRSGGSVDV